MTGPAVQISGLTVRRGPHLVLDRLDVEIVAGAITGLLGPSGAGKSTLIRAIVGVQLIESGTVTVLGVPAGSSSLRSRLGYVTQAPSVYEDLTVIENVRYFAALYGLGRAAASTAIGTVGLDAEVHQLTRDLSGGQRSRVSLACALVGGPDLLVLDEPTVGLDPVLRDELWTTFRMLADTGVTVLVSSHVMDEATRCDRLLLIREGVVIADAAPVEVLRSAGTDSMDQAFLTLIRSRGAVNAA